MLRQKIESISGYSQLSPPDKNRLVRAVARYLVFWKHAELKAVARELCLGPEMMKLKSSFLDSTTYASSKFWRALKMWLNGSPSRLIQQRCGVDQATLEFVLETLNPSDVMEMTVELNKYSLETISDEMRDRILKQVKPLCRFLAHNKMRFISRYDGGYELNDFEAELLVEALRVLNHYDYETNELYLVNVIKKSIKNYWARLIEYHTAQKRRRLGHVGTANTEYQVNVLSLDFISDEGEQSMHGKIQCEKADMGRSVEDGDFLSKLTTQIPPRIVQYVDIVLGREYPPRFEGYVEKKYKKVADDLQPHKLAAVAAEYLEISESELRELGMLVEQYGESKENR